MSRALMRGRLQRQYGPYFVYDEVGDLHVALTPEDKAKIQDGIRKRLEERKKLAHT